MKNNVINSINIKKDFIKNSVFKLSNHSPNEKKKLNQNQNRTNQNIVKKSKKRNLDNSLQKHINNLNSFSLETNSIQSLIYKVDPLNINNNQIKNIPIIPSKTNRVLITTNNNETKKKPTVNLSKNIEEIIKRRIIDKQNDNNKKITEKKNIFGNNRSITKKDLKNSLSTNKKGETKSKININKKKKKDNKKAFKTLNQNLNLNMSKEEENRNKKYYETKRISLSFEKDKNEDEPENNNINNNEHNDDKIYNISNLNFNCNTEEVNNEKIYKFYEKSNSFKANNYDYDSCIEDDLRSQKTKTKFIKSKSKSKSKDKNTKNNNCTDTVNKVLISEFEETKNSEKNIPLTKKESKEDEKVNSSKNSNKGNKINKSTGKKNVNQNNSTINTNDLSINTYINMTENNINMVEKISLSNNSIPKIDINKKENENIKEKISIDVNEINNEEEEQNNNKSNNKEKEDQNNNENNSKKSNISIDNKNNDNDNSSLNPSDSKSSNSKKVKPNIYEPKRITNNFFIKENINNNINTNNDSNNNNNNNKITYSKKIGPKIIYFQKNSNNLNKNKNENELDNNKTEIKIKNKGSFKKLNSSFEGTKNLQLNNIFMNNNIYNNNFNYPYRDTDSFINTEYQNNYFYNLNQSSNTNKVIYEINPATQLFFQMNNNNTNNTNKMQMINLNNSYNDYRNNIMLPINKENYYKQNEQLNNKDELLNKINFEDFIILDNKMMSIKDTLSGKNLIINECFEYLNYYYNSSIYKNLDYLFVNNIDINDIKICLGYKLLSIIICYNCSLDRNIFEQTYLLLKEILQLNYTNVILLYEYILDNIISNNFINIKNNLWLLKMKNIINNYKNNFNEYITFDKNTEMNIMEKMKINTNFIMNNINIIINNINTKNNEYLITLFKSMNDKLYQNIFFYFFSYFLHIINYQGSIIGNAISQYQLLNNINIIVPYIKTKNIKKYSLVLDLEETLLHFNINLNNNSEGMVDIRPGTIKFLDDISEFYELIVFNEGEQKYTDLLIDSLEQNKIYFEHRLYREHIIIDNNDVVKDLNRVGRALDKILIIDNMAQNFKFQKNNGILIKSFWGDNPNDNILDNLALILIQIAKDGGDLRNGLFKYRNEIVNKIVIGNNEYI